jgi:hypothetical protein
MVDKNFQQRPDSGEKNKAKIFWKHVGYIVLAIVLAALTVFVLNLNR